MGWWCGRLCSVSAAGASTNSLEYDSLGRVVESSQVTGGNTYEFSYSYNLAGGLTRMEYPSEMAADGAGRVVSYDFDDAGRVKKVVEGELASPVKTYAESIEYHAHGAMSEMVLGNESEEYYTYNNRLQPTSVLAQLPDGGSTLWALSNFYSDATTGNNGNVVSQSLTTAGLLLNQYYKYQDFPHNFSRLVPDEQSHLQRSGSFGRRTGAALGKDRLDSVGQRTETERWNPEEPL